MFFYLLQVTVLWFVFSVIYYFVLSNKSMFRFSRWYLLATLTGSFIIPLIPFAGIFGTVPFQSISLPQTVLLNELVIDINNENPSQSFNWIFWARSEEHTSELQSRPHLVCRLLLEKNKGMWP